VPDREERLLLDITDGLLKSANRSKCIQPSPSGFAKGPVIKKPGFEPGLQDLMRTSVSNIHLA